MDWEKASHELEEILGQAAEPFALVEKRKMFGGLCLFLNGYMFAGVHGRKIVLRLGRMIEQWLRTRPEPCLSSPCRAG